MTREVVHIIYGLIRGVPECKLSMHDHGDLENVGFLIAHHLLVCVRSAWARLINTDFDGLRHILNLSHTREECFLGTVDKWGPRNAKGCSIGFTDFL